MRLWAKGLAGAVIWLLWAGIAAADARCAAVATGGTVSLISVAGAPYCVHEFTSVGGFNLLRTRDVQYLVIGGGGGGGSGGGGAGGFLTGNVSPALVNHTINVGGGGASGTNGNRGGVGVTSSALGISAGGGGGGGNSTWLNNNANGGDGLFLGGSGGGAASVLGSASGGAGNGLGRNGANNAFTLFPFFTIRGGGGGGAGTDASGPSGGDGLASAITGSTVIYAAGGQASGGNANGAQNNAGSGGNESQQGRTGIVILRYRANFAPVADAGANISALAGSLVTLNGTGSTDPEDNIETYSWTRISGPSVTLTGASTAQPSFTAPTPSGASEVIVFALTVTDAFGATSTDQVNVTALSADNPPPPPGDGDIGVPSSACESTFATGGTVTLVTVDGVDHCLHQFTANGTFSPLRNLSVDYLVIGGGGGGGGITNVNAGGAGGGGAGGFRTGTRDATQGANLNVLVGSGGQGAACGTTCAAGANGGNSQFAQFVAQGGGRGGYIGNNNGAQGGSGGGARLNDNATGGNGITTQGNAGGGGPNNTFTGSGGGGAGTSGAVSVNTTGGNGGSGQSSAITGTDVFYAGGGGGGGASSGAGGNGGIGGGGSGPIGRGAGLSGQPNTGGGGGGATGSENGRAFNGGAGGAGIVIIRYRANNEPPIADAGVDIVALAGTQVTLDGTGSSDPEDNIETYSWTRISGPVVTLSGANSAQPNFIAPAPNGASEAIVFELTVSDVFAETSTDRVSVTLLSVNNPPPPSGGGGTTVVEFNDIENNKTWRLHRFESSGTFNLSAPGLVEYLIVGGGGGGGAFAGGGGGGGGFQSGTVMLPTGNNEVLIGLGGAGDSRSSWPSALVPGGENGQPSSVFGITVQGGGGGGTYNTSTNRGNGRDGASGGGASHNGTAGNGAVGQGTNGASGTLGFGISSGGGGGGAGQTGVAGTTALAGRGGNGVSSSLTGQPIVYSGGGAGGGDMRSPGNAGNSGGNGGGGASRVNVPAAESGVNGLGGGGGGGRVGNNGVASSGGNGGSGVVILRYVINIGPTADAGDDTTAFAGRLFPLDGTGTTDPDDNIETYAWEQIDGTPVSLTDADTAQPSFIPHQPTSAESEILTFRLTVTDEYDLSTTDTVVITLRATAVLTATKTVAVFSEDGRGCSDLSVALPATPAQPAAIPGACMVYVIIVENDGLVAAQGITLTDLLSDDLTFEAAELGDNWEAGTVLQTPTPGCAQSECTVGIADGVIAAGETATITIRATIR